MGDAETWRWVWLIAMVVFGVGEMAVAGSFFLAPFAIGAGVAAILAFTGIDVGFQWFAFVGVSAASFAALRPVARRLDAEGPVLGVGAHRQVGQRARVTAAITPTGEGKVMLDRELWRATSADGQPIDVGSTVVITDVQGTRVVVSPVGRTDPNPLPETGA